MKLEHFINIVTPYTLTTIERIKALFQTLEYIRINKIEGDFIECGVWKGGNILGILEYLDFYKIHGVNVWLYDTFTGMSSPEDIDVDWKGDKAENSHFGEGKYNVSVKEVKQILSISNFPTENIKFIVGKVEETLNVNENLPLKIALLRLDTDWYKSTKKEMDVLFPLLSKNGILIVDDYGHWQGAKKAINEYFKEQNILLDFEKIDYTGIKIIKK